MMKCSVIRNSDENGISQEIFPGKYLKFSEHLFTNTAVSKSILFACQKYSQGDFM